MAIRPLFPLTKQFQARNGQNNVSGTLEVFYAYTDDRAPTYSDYNGTRNPDLVPIDNNGRAVVLCDDERVYRLVVRDRSGGILWTQEPTVCEGEGSGGSTSIVSEDGSIVVQRTGSVYDLSVNHTDDSRFLDWIRCTGGESVSGYLRPVKAAGTMAVGSLGLSLSPDVLYHVTATVRAVKGSVAPVYGEVSVTLALHDGETATAVRTFSEIADCSMGLSQDYIVDADVHTPSNATQLVFSVTGDDASLSFLLLSVDAHRVYSGVPRIPDEVAQKTWVNANFQKKLVAGANITIDPVTNTISADALTQVQADWAQSNPADMSYIRNKPTLATVATSGSYDDLSDKPSIPAPQVQSDWNEADNTKADYIKNKPSLASVATSGDYDDLNNKPNLAAVATSGDYDDLSNKPTIPPAQVQSNWNESDSSSKAYIQNKPNLASVATSGDYNDLNNKPTIPVVKTLVAGQNVTLDETESTITINAEGGHITQEQANWTETNPQEPSYIRNKPNLATVATSGDYDDLTNKPTIPAAQVQSDWNEADSSKVDYIKNKPNLATVATTGDYDDLSNKPSIPVVPAMKSLVAGQNVTITEDANGVTISASGAPQQQADWDQTNSQAVDYIKNKPTIPAAQVQSDWSQSDNTKVDYIKNKPNLATVATSGSYDDLIDKPSIPAAQVNSDWNASSGVAEILNKPTLAAVATSGDYADLSGTPTINNVPAVTSGDDGKVLTASYSGGVGSYSWATGGGGGGTVDQTYDPTSTNAQSGTAVAQAVGTKQDTLTAGDGIDITSNVIKWLNTAGITDIQYVQSLPQNPDVHTLYLIPET